MVWAGPTGPFRWLDPEGLDRFWLRLHFANDGLLIATYLPAVAVSIRSKLLLPFRPRRAVVAMIGLALINAIFVFATPDFYLRDGPPIAGPGPMIACSGPGVAVLFALLVVSFLLGLLATLVARRSAPGPLARRQATLLALAFGARGRAPGRPGDAVGAGHARVQALPEAPGLRRGRRRSEGVRVDGHLEGLATTLRIGCGGRSERVVVDRKRVSHERRKNFQLDLFSPDDGHFEHSIVATNKKLGISALWYFMAGRGLIRRPSPSSRAGWPSRSHEPWICVFPMLPVWPVA
jgi:hypothetical protein